MRVTSKAALAPNLLPTSNRRVLLLRGVGAPAEHREIGYGMQAATDIGDPGEPRPGQRNRSQLQRLDNLATVRQIDQPVLLARPYTQPRRGATPLRGGREAPGKVRLKIPKTGFLSHSGQGNAAIFFSNSSGLTGLTM